MMTNRTDILRLRSDLLRAVRDFFYTHDYIEVETPIRIKYPALELHIDAEPATDHYLRTSPELYMKRMLTEGSERIFELGACFRRGERGALHNPEYTMLEWYRVGADYLGVLDDTKELLCSVAEKILGGTRLTFNGVTIDLAGEWAIFNVRDLFIEHAGWDPVVDFDADRFDLDLIEKVEPALPLDVPVVLKDFPAPLAALARLKPDDSSVAERWELYLGGIEIANVYSELTDADEQRSRFEECAAKRVALGKDAYMIDDEFLRALEKGMPACGGAALGIDRLVMLLSGVSEIMGVRAF
ncbi:MAG: EF-P lysine aminoacylase GenX [Kiritimatiellae bacterium]|nr:EF-P lysine aminoacylase GenX [Kiritimatiellia bacterium]